MKRQQAIKKKYTSNDYPLFIDKLVWVGLLILFQVVFLVFGYTQLREQYFNIQAGLSFISLLVVIYIINRSINPAYKLAWCTTILFVPVFGGLFYLLLAVNNTRRKFRKSIRAAVLESKTHLVQDELVLEHIEEISKHAVPQARYINDLAGYPVYENTSVKYFSSGEEMFISMLDELQKAEHFIFMEFFIIHEGAFGIAYWRF